VSANPPPERVKRGRVKLALLGAFIALPFALAVLNSFSFRELQPRSASV
jgi:hypothetical protein